MILQQPRFSGTRQQQLAQLQSYLHTLIPQLNLALGSLEHYRQTTARPAASTPQAQRARAEQQAAETFEAVKGLIIRSADIVRAYTECIRLELAGEYAAQSEFGDFQQQTRLALELNDQSITAAFAQNQQLATQLAASTGQLSAALQGVEQTDRELRAYIRMGQLATEEGLAVYGIEIGQDVEQNGTAVFCKCMRLSAGTLTFYNADGSVAAMASGDRLLCPQLEAEKLFLGGFGFLPRTSGNLSVRWTG